MMADVSRASFEAFERAFDGEIGTSRLRCECGVEYWDSCNRGYSWEEGEREALEADPNAVAVGHAIGTVEFEGRVYVNVCACWHERAKRVICFLQGHAHPIARFLNSERERALQAAERMPRMPDRGVIS